MQSNIIKKFDHWHTGICSAILILISLFMFVSGLRFEQTIWPIDWWLALIYGWSGLVVAFKLQNILYKD